MHFGKLANAFRIHAKEIDNNDKAARFRIANYIHAADIINATYATNTLVSKERIYSLPLTDYMKERALYFQKNIDKYSNYVHVDVKKSNNIKALVADLLKVQGIGVARARELIKKGLTSVAQLKLQKYYTLLPQETRIFIKYPPLTRIPRKVIEKIDTQLNKLRNKYNLTIVGSYRRQKMYSSDIDIMLVNNHNNNDNDLINLSKLLPSVLKGKLYIYLIGDVRLSAILIHDDISVKIDIFSVDEKHAASMLLYSTGSKEFNIRMRSIAKQKGMLLNQNGLYKDKKILDIKDEKGYFDALGMEYIEPKFRV